eukprot:gnl/TRDRNA2_/TRDRNA2_176150_c2_seq1.p2 gnl/TRDRNA2_/TRDRNA2_176150_c2~~gnl/TRDRNA2_/TRDRNA2_176150_c2_seq1.p2  ORF type:complete len:153 (+),score=20.07 gnl/TRDRNA2_/TRDRNA2_176150_c2_seq1:74-532(+)
MFMWGARMPIATVIITIEVMQRTFPGNVVVAWATKCHKLDAAFLEDISSVSVRTQSQGKATVIAGIKVKCASTESTMATKTLIPIEVNAVMSKARSERNADDSIQPDDKTVKPADCIVENTKFSTSKLSSETAPSDMACTADSWSLGMINNE